MSGIIHTILGFEVFRKVQIQTSLTSDSTDKKNTGINLPIKLMQFGATWKH